MSMLNQWTSLIEYCFREKLGVIISPTGTGEPWLHVDAIAALTGLSSRTIINKMSAGKVSRHPAFNSFVQLSEFEKVLPYEEIEEA